MKHDEYIKRRDELLGIRMDSFSSFDKAILSLGTGSLALSITFLDKIGEPFSSATFALIVLAWVSFFLVILFNLGSYYFARANMDRKITDLNAKYQKELDSGTPDTSPEALFWQRRATSQCNTGAFIAFAVGVLFFVLYIVSIQANNYEKMNTRLTKEKEMTEKHQPLSEGKTESPKAVAPVTQKIVLPGSDITTHGATETPQAVLRPAKPAEGSSTGSQKTK